MGAEATAKEVAKVAAMISLDLFMSDLTVGFVALITKVLSKLN